MSPSSNFLSGIGWRKHFYHSWFWRVFRHPLRTMGLKYYKGAPKLQELELLDRRSLWLRVGTSDRSIVWEVFLKDNYCTERIEGRLACVVDIGAQIGLFSLKMAPRADRILMFEPEPENFKLLSRNLSGPRHEHVEKFNKAVAKQAGTLRLFVAPDNPGHTRLSRLQLPPWRNSRKWKPCGCLTFLTPARSPTSTISNSIVKARS